MKKFLVVLAGLVLALHLNGCTDSKDDNADQASPDAAAAVAADGTPKATPDEAQAGFLDDQLPEDSLGSAPKDAAKTPGADQAATPPAMDATTPPKDDLSLDDAAKAQAAPVAKEDTPAAPVDSAPAKPMAPLQKVKDAPYKQGDKLINACYIARPGDSLKSISQAVYGNPDHVKDLKAINPALKKVKPGQKVYYASPNRPQDEAKMLNFYEDTGVPAQTYVSKDGDQLKAVSQNLLGYPEAWKEVWATNPVESKGALPAGTELRYWNGVGSTPAVPTMAGADGGAGAPPPQQAMNNMPPPPPAPDVAPPPPPAQQMPPPPPPTQAMNDMPPPPPPPAQAAPDIPPPPPPAMTPPPPPPTQAAMKKKAPAISGQMPAEDDDTIYMMAGAGAIAIAAAGYFIVRRRRIQKAAQAGFENQVGA